MIASKFLERHKKRGGGRLMTVPKIKNYTERLVQICFVIQCSYVKWVEHLFSVAEKAKKRRVICIRTLLMVPLVAFCTFEPLFAASVSGIQP
jgi:hypothetical protein